MNRRTDKQMKAFYLVRNYLTRAKHSISEFRLFSTQTINMYDRNGHNKGNCAGKLAIQNLI